MNENNFSQIRNRINDIYRQESRSIFATLIRLIGDFDLAEEAMHEAFAVAIKQWHRDGIPANPKAWLVSVGRFKAIDTTSSTGDLILLEDQDRSRWNQALISEGRELVQRSLSSGEFGVYTLQAAIAAVHSEAASAAATEWAQIVSLYDVLLQAQPSAIVELNRAVGMAMRDGYLAGLQAIDTIFGRGDLLEYHLAHAA